MVPFYFFFFSSRRRHTRWPRDWSSDVCSSDLDFTGGGSHSHPPFGEFDVYLTDELHPVTEGLTERFTVTDELYRSEERRVGKERRAQLWRWQKTKHK